LVPIVDDNPANLGVLVELLTRQDLEVSIAEDGESGYPAHRQAGYIPAVLQAIIVSSLANRVESIYTLAGIAMDYSTFVRVNDSNDALRSSAHPVAGCRAGRASPI
jgi:CheY-like chemotaxis protein